MWRSVDKRGQSVFGVPRTGPASTAVVSVWEPGAECRRRVHVRDNDKLRQVDAVPSASTECAPLHQVHGTGKDKSSVALQRRQDCLQCVRLDVRGLQDAPFSAECTSTHGRPVPVPTLAPSSSSFRPSYILSMASFCFRVSSCSVISSAPAGRHVTKGHVVLRPAQPRVQP